MTSSTRKKKYSANIMRQAEWQMINCTDAEDLLECLAKPPVGSYSFKNLEIFFEDQEQWSFNDLHLMLELLTNAMPAVADFDKKIHTNGFHHSFVLGKLLENCKFSPEAEAAICKEFLRGTGHLKGFQKTMRDKVREFLDNHPNTMFEYMYRCGGNYKSHVEVTFAGHLDLLSIKDNFHDHKYFIAHQIDLEAPQMSLPMDEELDHCLCEITDVRYTDYDPTEYRTANEFTVDFNDAAWDFAEAIEKYGL